MRVVNIDSAREVTIDIPGLKAAEVDLRFLLRRNYQRDSALSFVGNHYQLGALERNLLYRGVFTRETAKKRRSKTVNVRRLEGAPLIVDGYNCFITLENCLDGQPMIYADDGFVRDARRVFRSYRPSQKTLHAWSLIARVLRRHPPSFILVLLDAPYSGSGKFASNINRWLKAEDLSGNARTETRNESFVASIQGIKASADSVIIDKSDRVFDLAGYIIKKILKAGGKTV